ncbi:ribonuclease H-like protein [Rhizophagus irregularis]|uniref:Ribonuclease H-like protein n=1 Tax=Rhizophagus irregularis TaxID=588596 RepID=A0A2N0QTW1_9GLOM|nr:ribonuclease H-like protein [Rhizophagus irregularis]
MAIREIFITHRCLNLLQKIGTSNSYPLIYASQLMLPSGHTMSWKNDEKIECLIIEVCNIEICSDNSQKAIIQKQKCSKIITITQHNVLVLPIFIRLSTGAITHINWYYIVESLNRTKNILANSDIQQLEKTPTINLNGDNLGLWINQWIEQDTLKQELTNIRHQLKLLKNIEYYTDGSLANRTINNNDLLYRADNTTVDLGAAFYTSNELGEFSVYSCLSLWPSSTRAEIVAIFLALLTAPENSNVTIYTDSLGAINSINSAFNSTTRTWLKKTNNLIIIKIIMLIREASINLKLVKIKGHSGIIGNDIADKLAKKGRCENNLFRNNVDFINNILSYFPVFIDKPIEVNIRRFILKILATGEDFIRKVLQNILGITAKSEKFQKFQHLALETLMANILIRFKKLIWKPRCKQVILWEKREVKDNSNQLIKIYK